MLTISFSDVKRSLEDMKRKMTEDTKRMTEDTNKRMEDTNRRMTALEEERKSGKSTYMLYTTLIQIPYLPNN